mmetsp:Transcript_67231/g.161107  ORF Transcript_67231/g.161107 Transcript_67231/m.161107 type:complete len:543 (-) Transcript_67231:109-1737(-)|eukprot:CAMPEP_0178415120 /NCGR_PEP_ID=MMETSP0689_2-20121128/23388_1 /TAXON_ID=160604 /ORGANISM="Amphidinium massartii, Strain CS-259" /LENGTH=542 /DNA_ID=CAMNT_0020036431 /DNA_START=3 /DNA_END=1631 /DNA_ORIENTATION=-
MAEEEEEEDGEEMAEENENMLEASSESAAAATLRGKRTRISGAVEEDGNPGAINRKNRGSVFGALVGSSSKKARTASWRDELDEEEQAAVAATGSASTPSGASKPAASAAPPKRMVVPLPDEESDSDEMIDPGTPLPSEDEEAPPAAAEAPGGAAEAAPEAAASGDGAAPSSEAVAAAPEGGQPPPNGESAGKVADASAGVDAPVNGHAKAADSAAPAAPATQANGSAEEATPAPEGKRQGVVVAIEMVSGPEDDEEVSAPFEILCWGSKPEVEQKLASCLLPGPGAIVQALYAGAFCTFANHESISSAVVASKAAEMQASANGSAPAVLHNTAGILSAPVNGTGLLLTFAAQPGLDATHRPVGLVLRGKHNLRRLDVLAPCTGGGEPSQPLHFRVVGVKSKAEPADGTSENPAPVAEQIRPPVAGIATQRPECAQLDPVTVSTNIEPFSWEDSQEVVPSDELELIDLGLDMREAELNWLKGQTFSRERQQGVDAVQGALATARADVERVKEAAAADEALSQRRCWLEERTRYLLRLVEKLQ